MTIYLDERALTEINFRLIEKYSPKEDKLVRDMTALNMMVNLPMQYVFGKEIYPTLHDKAAILFIKLVLKHPFANGNKRTATHAALMFLKINGLPLDTHIEKLEYLAVYVAKNGHTDDTYAHTVSILKKLTMTG
jgi:death-on-curing protein